MLDAGKLLLVSENIVKTALAKSMADGELAQENIAGHELVFLPALKRAEENIAERIKILAAQPPHYPVVEFDKAVAWCQQTTGKELAPSQREAVKQALTNRMAFALTAFTTISNTYLAKSKNDQNSFDWQLIMAKTNRPSSQQGC